MDSLGQCLSYKSGIVISEIHLPEDYPVCHYCQLGLHKVYERWECRFTNEIILSPKTTRGDLCPIQFYEEASDGDATVSPSAGGSD